MLDRITAILFVNFFSRSLFTIHYFSLPFFSILSFLYLFSHHLILLQRVSVINMSEDEINHLLHSKGFEKQQATEEPPEDTEHSDL